MKRWSFLALMSLGLITMSGRAFGQTNTFPWPMNPPVGIGTTAPASALHINFSSSGHNDTAFIRLSDSTSSVYAILGLTPYAYPYYSSLSTGEDLIIHEHSQGDLILTNYQSYSLSHPYGAIRMATTPAPYLIPTPLPLAHDFERLTIMPNGNIGIDLPPIATGVSAGLDSAADQLQLGGGVMPAPGELDPGPGLTFSGGSRFEGMPKFGGGLFPADWRYIAFNSYVDHSDSTPNRFKRFARMASSGISFADYQQGTLQLWAEPYDATHSNNGNHSMTLNLTGQSGLALWVYDSAAAYDPYHHLFDVFPPGYTTWPLLRNPNGAFIHHTPVYITSDSTSTPSANFQNLSVQPDMGDDSTWMLVVNGPELAKEIFVLDSAWADYVFDPNYKLPSLEDVESYIKANHHLPDIEPASKIAKTGVPIGRTEEALTKKVEELTLYVIDQNKKIEQLESEIQQLKKQKEK